MDAAVKVIKGDSALFLKQSRKLAVIIPRKNVILKSVVLPAANERGVSVLLSQQVPQWLPLNGEGVLFDFFIREVGDGKTAGLVAMVAEKDIEAIRQEIQRFKFSSSEWLLSSTCLLDLLLFVRPEVAEDARPFLLLHVEAGSVEFCLAHGKKFLFSRYLDLAQDEAGGESFSVEEIKRTIRVCARDGSAPSPEVIYFLGQEPPVWCKKLSCELIVPLEVVNVDKKAGADQIDDPALGYILHGALATRIQPTFDLKPPIVKKEEHWRRIKMNVGRSVLFLGLACFLWQAAWQIEVDGLVAVNHFLAEKIKQHTPEFTRAQKQEEARITVENFLARKFYFNTWLSKLCQVMPDALFWENVEFKPDGKWRLKGVGLKEKDVQGFSQHNQIENVHQEKRGSKDVCVFLMSGQEGKKGAPGEK